MSKNLEFLIDLVKKLLDRKIITNPYIILLN